MSNQDKISEVTIRGIDPELKRKFKIYCVTHNTTIKNVLIEYIESLVKNT